MILERCRLDFKTKIQDICFRHYNSTITNSTEKKSKKRKEMLDNANNSYLPI